MNLVVTMVWDRLMARALDGTRNLERLAVWKKDILLDSLADVMRLWIVLDRLLHGFQRSQSPKQVQSCSCCKWQFTNIFQNSLHLKPYKLQVVQKLIVRDKQLRFQLAVHLGAQILEHDNFLSHIFFTDEAKVHISGRGSCHNCVIWGSEPPRERLEQYSSKVNLWWTWESHLPILLWRGHHYKQFISRHVGKLCSSIAQWRQQRQQQQSYSSTGWRTSSCCPHCLWLFEHEFIRSVDMMRRSNCKAPLFAWSYAFGLFLWCYVKDQVCIPEKEYIGWNQTTDHCRQTFQRICYNTSVKRWDVGRAIGDARCEGFHT
jgi:hypothetical protein